MACSLESQESPDCALCCPALWPLSRPGAAIKPLGRIFKLEDVSMGSWLEWIETERGLPVNRVKDTRWAGGRAGGLLPP